MIISIAENKRTVVPLGIADYKSRPENAFFVFNYTLSNSAADQLVFEITADKGQDLYQVLLGPEYCVPGMHQLFWDGFDQDEIYDSSRFDGRQLKATLRVTSAGETTSFTLDFFTQYEEVQWVDILIERKIKRITTTLRTSFHSMPPAGLFRIGRAPLETPKRTFGELLQLATAGLEYYWGRNRSHPVGKNVKLANGEEYEFFLKVDNTSNRGLKSPKIIYQTNARARRSRNWELSRILFYNVGYLKHAGKWHYRSAATADADFKQIAAHEIGHEILLAFGGHVYSKTHKGSSTIVTQSPLGNYLYPQQGEIDLMCYYADDQDHPCPTDYNSRSVASERDALSLLWLSKIKITMLR